LSRCLIDDPTHRGVAATLQRLLELKETESAFAKVQMDCYVEFREAIRLGAFETPEAGLAEITHRRTYMCPKPPSRAISIIYKAKGLECDSVLLMPCDRKTFPAKDDARCLLYVALRARAKTNSQIG
jgi:superfamily I DNA/RNA helicase